MDNLSLQYPAWYLLLCVLLGALYAFFLYFRNKSFREKGNLLNPLLAVLRFAAVTLLAILLLEPLLKKLDLDTRDPMVVFAQDVSASVSANWDESLGATYLEKLQGFESNLGEGIRFQQLAFGEEVRAGLPDTFADRSTSLSGVLEAVYDQYSNQNLGAVILASDGLYNQGSNPLYMSDKLGVPVYTVALGDTTPKRDLLLKQVFHNRIAYLGDRFSLQVDVAAAGCAGASSTLTIARIGSSGREVVERKTLSIDRADFFTTIPVELEADRPGLQRYRFSLSPVGEEATTANNAKDVFIDVLDARQKILILAQNPHPDITALRQTLLKNKNYEIEVAKPGALDKDVGAYDFAILHQVPGRDQAARSLLQRLDRENIPRLFILGRQTDYNAINAVQNLVEIRTDGRNTNDAQARVAPNFSLFTLSEQLVAELPNFVPLVAPFGDYELSPAARVALFQRIGRVDTRYPLLVLGEQSGIRTGVLLGEGIWKWRLYDYLQHENHDLFEEVIGKVIQYVSLKEDKRKFRVRAGSNIYSENESVVFDAELYNANYELVNTPDVLMSLTDESGSDYNFIFDKTRNAYRLDAGPLPVGTYQFQADTRLNGQAYSASGQFSVEPIQLELYESTADHQLLNLLARRNGGKMYAPDQLAALREDIRQLPGLKPVVYQSVVNQPVLNLKWIFFVLLALLSTEWFVRRYFGAY